MPNWELLILGLKLTWLLFVLANGACVGSLINVLVYRMPRGMSVVSPPSRCPSCQTRLTWRENVPVLGWLLLRGRCRFCRARISPEYPIVEAFTAGLFGLFYVLYYFVPTHASWLGVDWTVIKPDWFRNAAEQTWPEFVVLLVLLGSLVAVTLVDAKTSTIPLPIVWVPAAAGLAIHVGHAAWLGEAGAAAMRRAQGWTWAIPTPGPAAWGWVGLSIGAMAGIGASLALLKVGLITRSFADYDEWEKSVRGDVPATAEGAPATEGARPEDTWIQYPHARREMVKELAFLCLPVLLGIAGWHLATRLGAGTAVPIWVQVLSGVLLGYLIGGGLVWAVRVFGSLGFGKEAMGMGDVHLMAAVGACVGWIDSTLAFFSAAFVGVAWAVLGMVVGGPMKRAMPYGPFLAVATVLVILAKPLYEAGLGALLGRAVNLP